MSSQVYKAQVRLLLAVLPEVGKESCLALHGGTAINLFVRDMPRLSVDIDLTYIPIEDRTSSLAHISEALERIKDRLEARLPHARVIHRSDTGKLQVASQNAIIKLEVNLVGRGLLGETMSLPLCQKAQDEFETFCQVRIVPIGQLYGGKICAALDRQHPRDLFDVSYLFTHEGFSEDIKRGVLLGLVSSDRPMNELLAPNLLDQRQAMDNQFQGMSLEPFSYEAFESTRQTLLHTIHQALDERDRRFLLGIKAGQPDWSLHDFECFPAVQWKLLNLEKLRKSNPAKHTEQLRALAELLRNVQEQG